MNSPTAPELQTKPSVSTIAEPVVRLEEISVRYRAPQQRVDTFKEYAIRLLQRRVQFADFYALHDLSLEVGKGEVFGIIGRNGAGKSTLLKVISRVIVPTRGRVWVKGRVSPLLELGAGFHPELTGRENIFLNGTLLGHSSRDIESRLGDILEFAEIGTFIDAPLRTYSSGMVGRLGFAVATTWIPEILIVDEVLAVGDEAFRTKCEARMRNFQNEGTTIFLVTHTTKTIEDLCSRAAWLERGEIRAMGHVPDVVAAYRAGLAH
jgi:ABC-2 type transport system ATP-binding protein/lipopolysaccharide transport system ATP-binding protein